MVRVNPDSIRKKWVGKYVLIRSTGHHFHTSMACSFVQQPPQGRMERSGISRRVDEYFVTKMDDMVKTYDGQNFSICPECLGKERV